MKTLHFIATISLITFLLSLSFCTKLNDESNPSLTGSWKWVRSDGGIGYHIHDTPASTGKNIILNLKEDNRYTIFTNGVLSNQGTFTIEIRKCIHDHTDKNFINFSDTNTSDMMIEKLDNKSLEFSDEAYDGIGSLYARE